MLRNGRLLKFGLMATTSITLNLVSRLVQFLTGARGCSFSEVCELSWWTLWVSWTGVLDVLVRKAIDL